MASKRSEPKPRKGRKRGRIRNPESGGIGKQMIAASGGGRAALTAYRRMGVTGRTIAKATAAASGQGLAKIVRRTTAQTTAPTSGTRRRTRSERVAKFSAQKVPASQRRTSKSASSPRPPTSSSRGRQGPPAKQTPARRQLSETAAAAYRGNQQARARVAAQESPTASAYDQLQAALRRTRTR